MAALNVFHNRYRSVSGSCDFMHHAKHVRTSCPRFFPPAIRHQFFHRTTSSRSASSPRKGQSLLLTSRDHSTSCGLLRPSHPPPPQTSDFQHRHPVGQETTKKMQPSTMATNPPTDNAEQMIAPAAGPNGAQPTKEATAAEENAAVPPPQEARLPTRKDASLKEFLNKMDDYAPIVRLPRRGGR